MFPIPLVFTVTAKTIEQRTYNGPNGESRPYSVRRATCLDSDGIPWIVGWPDPREDRPSCPLETAGKGEEVELQIIALEEDKGVIRARCR